MIDRNKGLMSNHKTAETISFHKHHQKSRIAPYRDYQNPMSMTPIIDKGSSARSSGSARQVTLQVFKKLTSKCTRLLPSGNTRVSSSFEVSKVILSFYLYGWNTGRIFEGTIT